MLVVVVVVVVVVKIVAESIHSVHASAKVEKLCHTDFLNFSQKIIILCT